MDLKLAVKAGLPLIAVTTRDTLNFPSVLEEVVGKKPKKFSFDKLVKKTMTLEMGSLYFYIVKPKQAVAGLDTLYSLLIEHQASLVLVNMQEDDGAVFNAGEMPVPKEMIFNIFEQVVEDKGKAANLMSAVGGCTIKDASDLAALTMARDSGLTTKGLMKTRKQFFQGEKGLTLVDTAQTFYVPNQELTDWIKREKHFFLSSDNERLIPRGVLFDGPPGVGKTAGAKYIAEQFGVPLYRLDLGGVKGKWVGESERQNLIALNRLDREEPCVALLDEIEKIFDAKGSHGDSGTTTTMLSQLLWWLAEHKSRVLVVMTTNNIDAIPPELHREGRIDETMRFEGLDAPGAEEFVARVLYTFGKEFPDDQVVGIVAEAMEHSGFDTEPKTVSQAALTEYAIKAIKTDILATQT
jgi:hypothetical protein